MTIAPTKETTAAQPAEMLIKEARRRGRMHILGGTAILVMAASAVTATAVAFAPTTSSPHRSAAASALPPAAMAPSCPASSLRASFDGVDSGLAGSILIGFELKNVGSSSCTVQGHPSAIFRSSTGAIVNDIKVGRMGSIINGRMVTSSPRIALWKGRRAFADMIVPVCTGHSPGTLRSVQLVLRGALVSGVVTEGHQHGQPFGIGGVCEPGDPGTNVAISQLEPIRGFS